MIRNHTGTLPNTEAEASPSFLHLHFLVPKETLFSWLPPASQSIPSALPRGPCVSLVVLLFSHKLSG